MIKRYEECSLMSQIVCYEGFFETAGQVAENPNLDIQAQTKEALDAIDMLLAKIGAKKSNLTRIQIWMSEISEFDLMNEVYSKWLQDEPKPVRACVQSALVAGGYRIEIQAFGYLK